MGKKFIVDFNFLNQLDSPEKVASYTFPNMGVLFFKLPDDILNIIKNEIEVISNDRKNAISFTNNLAGHLKEEYKLNIIDKVNDYFVDKVQIYDEHYDILSKFSVLTKNKPIVLDQIWVNFQKKHEFNPLHDHSGLLSFVIWIKIPYDLKEEEKVFPGQLNQETSRFAFAYTNILGGINNCQIPIDKSFEGKMCIFPASLKHYVNPFFTSDEERISVSGNFRFLV